MNRHAFTLIELLMSLAIMAMLAGLGAPIVLQGMAKSRVAQAASGVATVAGEARAYAMNRRPTTEADGTVRVYGVAVWRASGSTWATLVWRGPNDGGTHRQYELVADPATGAIARANEQPGWKPVRRRQIPASVAWWLADEPATDGQEVAWYYRFRSGAPVGYATDAAWPASAATAQIGTWVDDAAFKAAWCGDASNNSSSAFLGMSGGSVSGSNPGVCSFVPGGKTTPAAKEVAWSLIAPGTSTVPQGFSLRTVDGRVRMALAIYANGIPVVSEWK